MRVKESGLCVRACVHVCICVSGSSDDGMDILARLHLDFTCAAPLVPTVTWSDANTATASPVIVVVPTIPGAVARRDRCAWGSRCGL